MAVYNLPPDEGWPTGLAKVIQSYMQGREIDRQRKLQERQTAATEKEALQRQAKTEADTARIKMITAIMRRYAGGGQQQGATGGYGVTGGKIGPPEESGGLDVMPGLELDRFGPSGPSFKVGGMGIDEALGMGLSDKVKGYEKPTVRVGPRGRVSGMTYAPKKQPFPEGFNSDLKNAVSAITRGADPYKVYRRIAASYPGQSTELKRILLYTPATKRLEAIREALFGNQ